MYKNDDIIEYLIFNNILKIEIEQIVKINFSQDSIQVVYYFEFDDNINYYQLVSKYIEIDKFEMFLLQKRIDKIKKIKKNI